LYNGKYIKEKLNAQFLGMQTDNHLTWKKHTEHTIPKLCEARYAITVMSHISNTDTLKTIYFAYFHCIIKYTIIFGENLPPTKYKGTYCQ
jgi:hypothetical protein